MKILPPAREWLPALARARSGRRALAAGAAVVGALVLLLVMLPRAGIVGTPVDGVDGQADPAAATGTAAECSTLVLDRTAYRTSVRSCSPASVRDDATRTALRPLERTDPPPNPHGLTAADRAIRAPETLRTSVWDIDVARTPGAASPAETALTGRQP
jgi:hypothetical protein